MNEPASRDPSPDALSRHARVYPFLDIRPVLQIVGLLLLPMGALMLPSAALDAVYGGQSWTIFAASGFLTMLLGGAIYLVSSNHGSPGLDIRQAFLLTTTIWVVLPLAGFRSCFRHDDDRVDDVCRA